MFGYYMLVLHCLLHLLLVGIILLEEGESFVQLPGHASLVIAIQPDLNLK